MYLIENFVLAQVVGGCDHCDDRSVEKREVEKREVEKREAEKRCAAHESED